MTNTENMMRFAALYAGQIKAGKAITLQSHPTSTAVRAIILNTQAKIIAVRSEGLSTYTTLRA